MLSEKLMSDVLNKALSSGGDFAELFMEDTRRTNIKMLDGYLEDAVSGRDFGIGLRILQNNQSIYAYTNDTADKALLQMAADAASALRGLPGENGLVLQRSTVPSRHPIVEYPSQVDAPRKAEVMRRAHSAAKGYSEQISQVAIMYADVEQDVMIANTDGLLVDDHRVRTRLAISSVASKDGEKQSGFYGPGRHMGFEMYGNLDIEHYAQEASRIAVTMVNAEYAPSGRFPVIINSEFGGVIFHEACGHGLEATSVAKGTSVFADKLGQQIASPLVSAVDDGTIPNAWGSQNIDDEGNSTRRNVLIENGILKGYMVDRLNGRRMDMEATGSARRQSYRYAPTSRMTNTFILNGASDPEEIVADTEYGLFARYMGGGSVNPATGEFNFAVNEGYLIRNGRLDKPVRGATLIGRGADILKKIDMVGNNLETGQGMCGSLSGAVPADVGQPTLRVSEMTVGGRKEEQS